MIKSQIIKINSKRYLSETNVSFLLGYKSLPDEVNCDLKRIDGSNYFKYREFKRVVKTCYNRRCAEVIFVHKELKIEANDYAIEAVSLYPICKYLKEQNIRYEYQFNVACYGRRIDLYLPEYSLGIECDEHGHRDRAVKDEILREDQLTTVGIDIFRYNPHEKNFDVSNVVEKLKVVIKEKQTEMAITSGDEKQIRKLLNEFNENSIERKYYDTFGESILGKGFVVDFDNVWKMLGYARKDPAKRALLKYASEDIDFSFPPESGKLNPDGRPMEKIMLTVDCFKHFCMMANTDEARSIRMWYLKMEKQYEQLLLSVSFRLSQSKSKVITAVKKITTKKANNKSI